MAHLATADKHGQPHVVPICYAFDGKDLYSPIDEKPKRATPLSLKRVRNIQSNPQVALVIDRYDEDWRKLAYVLVFGRAKLLAQGPRRERAVLFLRRKYSQYRRMAIHERPIVCIRPSRVVSWGAI